MERLKIHVPNRHNKCCGQASLAMLFGISFEEAATAVGSEKPTKAKQIAAAIEKLGAKHDWSGRRTRHDSSKPLPARCIAAVTYVRYGKRRGSWHWIAIIDGIVHDPDRPDVTDPVFYNGGVKGCITSYIRIMP